MASRHLVLPMILATALAACSDDKPTQTNASAETAAPPAQNAEPRPSAAPSPPDVPGGIVSKEDLASSVCFFTPEEVQAALGFAVQPGKPDTTNLASYGSASCRYEGQDNVLQINVFWLDPAQIAAARQSQSRLSTGDLQALPGDADGAYVQRQKGIGSGALHYIRRNVMIEIRPLTWRDDQPAMKDNLLKLRRVP